jgi:allantoin racemase
MRIRIITPIVMEKQSPNEHEKYIKSVQKLSGLCPSTRLDSVSIEKGPTSIESRFDEVLANPEIMQRIVEAEADGIDAVVVDCFADPGVKAGRELVKIPVVASGETSMLVASSLCNRFSVITVLKNVIPLLEENAAIYGVKDKLVSVRAIDIPVLELEKNPEKTARVLIQEGKRAIEEDKAETLVLGCTGMTGLAERLSKELEIHVVDPLPTALKFAETLISLKLSHSKRAYPNPPEKKRYE